MTRLERIIAADLSADGTEHTDRMFRARSELCEAVAGTRNALADTLELISDVDAMLAKGGKVLIQEYYRALKGGS